VSIATTRSLTNYGHNHPLGHLFSISQIKQIKIIRSKTASPSSSQGPFYAEIFHLIICNRTSVSTTRVLRYVLGGNLDVIANILKSVKEMDLCGSNENLHQVSFIFSLVQNFAWERINKFYVTVRFPVSTNQMFTRMDTSLEAFSTLWESIENHSGAV
jgi:hypothetical protein